MRTLICVLFNLLMLPAYLHAQETIQKERIPLDVIQPAVEGDRAGSCASPDGPIIGGTLTDYPPSFNWLWNNGHCYDIPTTKNANWCWTFTAPGTDVTLDCGFSVDVCGTFAFWFDAFYLYTCAPACTLVGTGLSFTGLTPGTCYTWCFETNFTGCGAAYGFTVLCPYLIYDGPTLPVEILQFTAWSENSINILDWSTASETNCMEYDILRSTDGVIFESIGKVNGNGTTTLSSSYTFLDSNAPAGISYYRLRQVDYNYNEMYSEVITCTREEGAAIRRYYTVSGNLVNIEDAPDGVYVEEIITGTRAVRKLIYHAASNR